ncbi:MAG: hypothetical protein SGCHY_000252 [Lobulomycetales sp.]
MSAQDFVKQQAEWWNPASPSCQFKHYFYNIVSKEQVGAYAGGDPQDPLFIQAQRDNPVGGSLVYSHTSQDPSCMVPVLAVGFADIKKRIQAQDEINQRHQAKLQEASQIFESLHTNHLVTSTAKLEKFKLAHLQNAQRALSLIKKISLLRNRGYAIRREEEAIKVRLEALQAQLRNRE